MIHGHVIVDPEADWATVVIADIIVRATTLESTRTTAIRHVRSSQVDFLECQSVVGSHFFYLWFDVFLPK